MNQPPWHRDRELPLDYYAIVPHATEARVLLTPDERGWTLPRFTPSELDFREVSHINTAMVGQLGLDTTVLRCVRHHYDPDTGQQYRVYALENHTSSARPPSDGRWVGRDELESLEIAVPEHYGLIASWFAERGSGDAPKLRASWARLGWYDTAVEWLDAQLRQSNIAVTGPIEQLRAWSLSCLMRISTDAGDVYFKAVPPFMAQESTIMRAVSERYPRQVPPPLAIDAERGWTLMRDFGGEWLGRVDDIEAWEGAVRTFAQIQVEQVEHVDHWMEQGCLDRGLGRMVELINPLLAVSTQTLLGQRWGLSESDVNELHGISMRLKLMGAQLANFSVPHTLVHGDLGGNIQVKGDSFIYFDWTDGCVSHPFLDTTTIIDTVFDEIDLFSDLDEVRMRLRNAYLEPWTKYEPMERLIEAFELAQPLGALHQAMSYMWIATNLAEDARWELEGGLVFWLRNLLRKCSAG